MTWWGSQVQSLHCPPSTLDVATRKVKSRCSHSRRVSDMLPPHVLFTLLAFLTAGTFALFARSFLAHRSFDLMPSLGWMCFMSIPMMLSWSFFPEPWRSTHTVGILLVAGFLLAADTSSLLILKRGIGKAGHTRMTEGFLNYVAWAATAILVAIAIYHLLTAEDIPLYDLLFKNATPEEYLAQRNSFQRDLPVPFFVRYLINFNVYIFGSLALVLHWTRGRKKTATTLAMAIFVYSALSTAKLPALIVIVIISALFATRLCQRSAWLPRALFLGLVAGLSVIISFDQVAAPKILKYYAHTPFTNGAHDDPRRIDTLGDYIRSPEADVVSRQRSLLYRKFEYAVYRIFLTPVEVSDRWYQYFSYVQKEPEPLGSLLGRAVGSDTPHPAVRVGRWAYHEKFPSKYTDNVHAYGSLDADAFAYGGLPAVLVAAFAFALVRISLAIFHTPNIIAETLYVMALVLMTAIPASGSLPALLVPHGLLAILGIMMGVWFWTGYMNRRDAIP